MNTRIVFLFVDAGHNKVSVGYPATSQTARRGVRKSEFLRIDTMGTQTYSTIRAKKVNDDVFIQLLKSISAIVYFE
jgi:hypothetical protein